MNREYRQNIYAKGMAKVATTPEPEGQKFPIGSRVGITKIKPLQIGDIYGVNKGTVKYTYAHAYWGDDVRSYCIDLDGYGEVSWFQEDQLRLLEE